MQTLQPVPTEQNKTENIPISYSSPVDSSKTGSRPIREKKQNPK